MTRPTPTPERSAWMKDADWWRSAVVYQIYPRSFADTDGDGIGNIAGVTAKADYLADLGVDAVWLSPFYPSALADGGYDVDDYRDVDPKLGTLAEFDEMVETLHGLGLKVIVDIVPNHSSDRHAWFQAALAAGRGSAERERYIFREGKGPDGAEPPNAWKSVFGGPAWKQVEDGQWFLHMFAPEQPDFNWDHPEVRADFERTIRFWSDRGVDGFRVDVAHALVKDLTEPLSETPLEVEEPIVDGTHPLWDRDDVHDVYADWRRIFDEYDPPRTAVAEAWVHHTRRGRYASPDGLGQAFNFDLLEAPFDAKTYREVVTHNLEQAVQTGASSTWVLSNHDVIRHPSRFGMPGAGGREVGNAWLLSDGAEPACDLDRGLRRARAASLLMLALPGSAYVYQGEELGLHEVADLPTESLQDPTWERSGHTVKGRDGCRVPLPWTSTGPSYGFGDGTAHLPQPTWFAAVSVAVQSGQPGSTLELYREALRLRRALQGAEEAEWVDEVDSDDVLHLVRPDGWHCVTNFGETPVPLPAGEVLLSSGPLEEGALPGETTVWLRRS